MEDSNSFPSSSDERTSGIISTPVASQLLNGILSARCLRGVAPKARAHLAVDLLLLLLQMRSAFMVDYASTITAQVLAKLLQEVRTGCYLACFPCE